MNFQFYLEKLKSSEGFQTFKKENPASFLCSAFFAIDKCGNDNKQHFDFFANEKIFSFQIENNCKKTELKNYSNETPAQVSDNVDFDFAEVEKIIQAKMNAGNVKNKIQKILLSLQNFEKVNYLIGTIFISGMGMIKIKINLNKMKIEDFEKKSFFDMFKVLKK